MTFVFLCVKINGLEKTTDLKYINYKDFREAKIAKKDFRKESCYEEPC